MRTRFLGLAITGACMWLALGEARGQTILGKSPYDKVTEAFFSGTNGNANNLVDWLSRHATHPWTGAVSGISSATNLTIYGPDGDPANPVVYDSQVDVAYDIVGVASVGFGSRCLYPEDGLPPQVATWGSPGFALFRGQYWGLDLGLTNASGVHPWHPGEVANGSGLTSLVASALTSGTIPVARLPALGAAYPNAITNNSTAPYTNLAGVASSFFGPGNGLTTTNGYTFTNATAQYYCARVNDTNTSSQAAMDQFFGGGTQPEPGVTLLDAAFFERPANNGPSLLTLSNTVTTVGPGVVRLAGGVWLSNYFSATCTNYMVINGLPASSNHTILVWVSQAMEGSMNGHVGAAVFHLADAGFGAYPFLIFPDSGGLLGQWYDYTPHAAASRLLGNYNDNRLVCFAATSGSAMQIWSIRDDLSLPMSYTSASGSLVQGLETPTTLWLGTLGGAYSGRTNCWNGLIRGWAYYDGVLSSNGVVALNNLVKRIGLVPTGDSKTVSAPNTGNSWNMFWQQAPATWGLFSTITNSGIPGTCLSHLNEGDGKSIEDRFAKDAAAVGFPSAKYPRIIYGLSGGQNDNSSWVRVTNALAASTNLISWAATNGWQTVQLDDDRTSTWGSGNSNYMDYFNSVLLSPGYPASLVVDIMGFYTNLFGPQPWTNTSVYQDTVHQTAYGSAVVGTNCIGIAANDANYPAFPNFIFPLLSRSIINDYGVGNAGHVTLAGGLALNCILTGGSNSPASWPKWSATPGGWAFGPSNGSMYLLTAAPGSTNWGQTNKLGGP